MGKKFDLKVGKAVFLNPVGNQARRYKEIQQAFIKSIGRKYFYVWDGENEYSETKWKLETFVQDNNGYNANWVIYETEQEILDKREVEQIHSHLSQEFFRPYGSKPLTLDQLRRIKAITEEEAK